MFTQDIGTSLALFYQEWAIYHELNSNKKKADEIFQLGINRNADPVDSLKEKHGLVECSINYYFSVALKSCWIFLKHLLKLRLTLVSRHLLASSVSTLFQACVCGCLIILNGIQVYNNK